MSKLLHNRVFRFLICLVLVLSLLVNLSPLKAKSTSIVVGTLTFEAVMAALYSLSIGVCVTAFTVDALNQIGQTLKKAITDTDDPTITEAWIDLEAFYDTYAPDGPANHEIKYA